jgi:hypothetical protein
VFSLVYEWLLDMVGFFYGFPCFEFFSNFKILFFVVFDFFCLVPNFLFSSEFFVKI